MKNEHILVALSRRYPQLLLPLSYETRKSELYRAAVLRGEPLEGTPEFSFSAEDTLTLCETPAGTAEVLYFAERADFEHAYRALACRCEPVDIPASVGASFIGGLINWEKIRRHREEYLAAGGEDWNEEFKRFTAVKENYRDAILLLSGGEYSAIPAEQVGLTRAEWIRSSVTIRQYHELTHFVCRKLYPDDIDALRDEVIADCIGLLAALGHYDTGLAALFFGVEGESFREGGRLSHYTAEGELQEACGRVRALIAEYALRIKGRENENVFDLLLSFFEAKTE